MHGKCKIYKHTILVAWPEENVRRRQYFLYVSFLRRITYRRIFYLSTLPPCPDILILIARSLFEGNEENDDISQARDPEYAAKCHPIDHQVPCGNSFLCLEMPVNIITVRTFYAYRNWRMESSQLGVMLPWNTLDRHACFVNILVTQVTL
jgi:hypothetical protein